MPEFYIANRATGADTSWYVTVTLTKWSVVELLKAKAAREAADAAIGIGDVYSIDIWDYGPAWRNGTVEPVEPTTHYEDEDWLLVSLPPAADQDDRVQVPCCRIVDTGVLWAASPKHSDDNLETPELSWKVLERLAALDWDAPDFKPDDYFSRGTADPDAVLAAEDEEDDDGANDE